MPANTPNQSVVALGNFDGLHLGHRRLITSAVELGQKMDLIPTVWSFHTHPALILGNRHPGILMQAERRSKALMAMGIRQEITEDFTKVSDLSPVDFVEQILQNRLHAAHVVCGFNYSFGKKAAGDAALLEELLQERGMGLTVIDPVSYQGETVSSSRIRSLLQEGETGLANTLLGAPLALEATVEKGKQLARQWGIPTANQSLPKDFVRLRHGVYATRIHHQGQSYPAISNVGLRPTLEDSQNANCESYLFGFEGELYGRTLTCEFLHFIRPERRFDNAEKLKQQIDLDLREVQQYFESHA